MQVNKINQKNSNISFHGPLDGAVTTALRTFDKNPMANAVGIDLIAMVGPRTYVDAKERNKYAGAETFFREFTGTFTVCLGGSFFAKGISMFANKVIDPQYKLNTKSWFTDDSVAFLKAANENTSSVKDYVSNVVNALPYKNAPTEFVEKSSWDNLRWDNPKYKNIHKKIKDKESLISTLSEIIEDKTLTNADRNRLTKILNLRTVNLIDRDNVNVSISNKKLSSSVSNLLRDTIDMGRDVFSKSKAEQIKYIEKILKVNKIKNVGALVIASSLGLINQYVNRKITEKRTGIKGFVGNVDYKENIKSKKSSKDISGKFLLEKLVASLGMAAMAISVMGIKSPKAFFKKLELTGPVTSGNVIKTVYASTLIGRFMASSNKDELRETVFRDYLGFLNWLVLGGFAAKGVANILDPKKEFLFHEANKGKKGIRHWLKDVSLKSHDEIAVKGKLFANKNMWKLNAAHFSGLAYSTIVLGILLPKLNIYMTKKKQENLKKVN